MLFDVKSHQLSSALQKNYLFDSFTYQRFVQQLDDHERGQRLYIDGEVILVLADEKEGATEGRTHIFIKFMPNN